MEVNLQIQNELNVVTDFQKIVTIYLFPECNQVSRSPEEGYADFTLFHFEIIGCHNGYGNSD